jgi:Phage integrase family
MRGTPLQPSNFRRRVWGPALRLAGLEGEGYRFHDLRHTCVSRLVAAGADVKLVQAVAGHANPLITLKRYSHLLDGRVPRPLTASSRRASRSALDDRQALSPGQARRGGVVRSDRLQARFLSNPLAAHRLRRRGC